MDEFEKLGGMSMLQLVSKIFYDKIYAHPWIGQYFKEIDQSFIESQQVDFMADALGGPKQYLGKFVPKAHAHMLINEELFQLREQLLNEAFAEAGACEALVKKWNKIDRAFKAKVVKKSKDECVQRYADEGIVEFPDPDSKNRN